MVCSLTIKSWGKFINKCSRSHSSLWGNFLQIHLTRWLHLLQMLPLLETFGKVSWELASESVAHLFCSPQGYQIFILGRWDALTVFLRLAFFQKVSKLLLAKCWNKTTASYKELDYWMIPDWLLDCGWREVGMEIAVKDIAEKVDEIWMWTVNYIIVLCNVKVLNFGNYTEVVCIREWLCS